MRFHHDERLSGVFHVDPDGSARPLTFWERVWFWMGGNP
jgi:hypothetical protein